MAQQQHLIPLHRVAITRSGDKGDVSNIGVIAFSSDLYRILKKRLTPVAIKNYFKGMVKGDVTIYPMDNIEALQVVMKGALAGGATKTLRFDQTGKSMSVLMQSLEIPFEADEMNLIPNGPPFNKNGEKS